VNRNQKIALWAGLCNAVFLLLFPPYDSLSLLDANALIFAGFNFVFARASNEVINTDVLFLEMVVLLVNVGVAWLLLRDTKPEPGARRFNFQNAILLMVAVNLTVILLFPPFEYVYAVTKAILPTFQGFYFIFSAGPMLTIITPILYLEVIFVLVNGALLWLFFRKGKPKELSPQETMELMHKLSGKH
jgi:hypothetical protein